MGWPDGSGGWPDGSGGWPDGSGGWPDGSGGWPSGDIVVTELATWSATDKHANITLDATKLIATQAVNNALVSLRASIGKSTGKYLFEITKGIADSYVYIGFADSAASLNIQLGSSILVPASISVGHRLAAYYANNVTTSGTAPTNVTTPYLFAVDCDLGHGWIAKADAWAQGDPTTDTSPSFTWAAGTTIYPAASLSNSSTPDNTATLNAGQSPFANSILAAACVAAGYKEGFGNFAAPVIEYIYGLNGDVRGEILDGVTTMYDTVLLDITTDVWSTIAGASSSTGWIANGTDTVTFNTLAAHPYSVNDKLSIPYTSQGITVNSGAILPSGVWTIQATPTANSYTAKPDTLAPIITTGTGNFDGYTSYDLYHYTIPYGLWKVGEQLKITGNVYFASGSNSKTVEIQLDDTIFSKILVLNTSGAAVNVPFSSVVTYNGFGDLTAVPAASFNANLNPEVDDIDIYVKCFKDAASANDGVALTAFKIEIIRNP